MAEPVSAEADQPTADAEEEQIAWYRPWYKWLVAAVLALVIEPEIAGLLILLAGLPLGITMIGSASGFAAQTIGLLVTWLIITTAIVAFGTWLSRR